MSRPLPLRANLEWLKKLSKDRLGVLRAGNPGATLSEAQRADAQEYGFPSWRKLKAHVEQIREQLDALVSPAQLRRSATEVVALDDPDLARLLEAVGAGEAQAVADLLSRRPVLATAHGPDGQTPLHVAARYNDPRIAADGSRLPCPPPTVREQVSDALYIACRNGQVDVVRFLLGKQPDLSFRAYMGATPLHWAYFGGSRTVVDLLERAGADPSARDDTLGCTPRAFGICAPASWGFAFLVRARLADDPTLVDVMDGRTSPLHEAARSGSAEVVRLLLDHGAHPSRADGAGKTPFDLATDRGHTAAAELL